MICCIDVLIVITCLCNWIVIVRYFYFGLYVTSNLYMIWLVDWLIALKQEKNRHLKWAMIELLQSQEIVLLLVLDCTRSIKFKRNTSYNRFYLSTPLVINLQGIVL